MNIQFLNLDIENDNYVYRYMQDKFVALSLSNLNANQEYELTVDLMELLQDNSTQLYKPKCNIKYSFSLFAPDSKVSVASYENKINLCTDADGNCTILYKIKYDSSGFTTKGLYKLKVSSKSFEVEGLSDSFRIMTKKDFKATQNYLTTILTAILQITNRIEEITDENELRNM